VQMLTNEQIQEVFDKSGWDKVQFKDEVIYSKKDGYKYKTASSTKEFKQVILDRKEEPKDIILQGRTGPTRFTGLSDTPDSYSGQTGLCTAVNGAEDSLEFVACGGITTVLGLGLQAGAIVYGNSASSSVQLASSSANSLLEIDDNGFPGYTKTVGAPDDSLIGYFSTITASTTVTDVLQINQSIDPAPLKLATTTGNVDFQFTYDTDTGVNWESDNKIALYTGNSPRLTIDSSGFVGIASSTPTYDLSINSNFGIDSSGQVIDGTWQADAIGVAYGGTGLTSATAGNVLIGFDATNLQATSTLFINSSGNVGIGTTTPEALLSLQGTSGQTNNIFEIQKSDGTELFSVEDDGRVFTTIDGQTNTVIIGNSPSVSPFAQQAVIGSGHTSSGNTGNSAVVGARITWKLGAVAMGDLTGCGERSVCIGSEAGSVNADNSIILGYATGQGDSDDNVLKINNFPFRNDIDLVYGEFDNKLVTINGDFFVASTSVSYATSTIIDGTLEIPNGSEPLTGTTGQIAIDTTNDQLHYFGATATSTLINYQPASFTYATSTAWSATTTIPLGVAWEAETWSGVKCFTDTGTLNVDFNDGTNKMNLFNASTTVGTIDLSTNNTFTASEKRFVNIGTPASTPTKISCTVRKSVDAN